MDGGDSAKRAPTISFKDVPTPVENRRRQQGIGARYRKHDGVLTPKVGSDGGVANLDDLPRESVLPPNRPASLPSEGESHRAIGTAYAADEESTTATLPPDKLAAEMQNATEGLRQLRVEMNRHMEESLRDAPPALISRQVGSGDGPKRPEQAPHDGDGSDALHQKQAAGSIGASSGTVMGGDAGGTFGVTSLPGERRVADAKLAWVEHESDRAVASGFAEWPATLPPSPNQARASTSTNPLHLPTLSGAPPPGHFSSLATALGNARRSDSPPSSDLLGRASRACYTTSNFHFHSAPSDAGGRRCTPGAFPDFRAAYRSSLTTPGLRPSDVVDEPVVPTRLSLDGPTTLGPERPRSATDDNRTSGYGVVAENNPATTSPRIALPPSALPSFKNTPVISHAWAEDSTISPAALRAHPEFIRDHWATPSPNSRPLLPTASLARQDDSHRPNPVCAAARLLNSHNPSRTLAPVDIASRPSRRLPSDSSLPLARPLTTNSDGDNRSLRADVDTLLKVNAALQAEVDRINLRDNHTDASNAHWEVQCRTLQEKVRQLEQDGLHACTAHVCKLEEEVDCLGSLLRAARAQNTDHLERLAAANTQTAALQEERDAARLDQHTLGDELQRSRTQREEAQRTLCEKAEQWECRLQEFEKYKGGMEQAAHAEKKLLEEEMRMLEERVHQLEAIAEGQREEVTASRDMADRCTKQEELLRTELQRYKAEILLAKEAIRRSSKWERTQILESAEQQARQNSELQNVNQMLRMELEQAQERNRELASEVATAYDFQKLTSMKAHKRSMVEMEELRQWKTNALLSMQEAHNEFEELQMKHKKLLGCTRTSQNKVNIQNASIPGSPDENNEPSKKCPLTNVALKNSMRDRQLMIDDSVPSTASRCDNGMTSTASRCDNGIVYRGNRCDNGMVYRGNRGDGSMISRGKKSFLEETIMSMSSHAKDSVQARDSIDSRLDRTATTKKKTRAKSLPKRGRIIERPFR
eukprot:GEMP01004271.1.p1 GENE.GEMP01004271.1~~GEMP01004271.1.p1  ORF type:complete len:988 (+),score=285.28 GEMP01004271.1:2-2965(+)